MTNNELLLAISDMMDRKLDEKLDTKLDEKISVLSDRMDRKLDEKLEPVKADITSIKMTLENNILPRLQNIEACYVSTYERYRDCADRMEAACDDVALLKKVVAEHSEKLKKIS